MDVAHEDFNCPTIIHKKIYAISPLNVKPRISLIFCIKKTCFQIRNSIIRPEKIANVPFKITGKFILGGAIIPGGGRERDRDRKRGN